MRPGILNLATFLHPAQRALPLDQILEGLGEFLPHLRARQRRHRREILHRKCLSAIGLGTVGRVDPASGPRPIRTPTASIVHHVFI